MTRSFKARIAVLTANIIYGANYSIAKEVMPSYIKPFGFILIRVCVAAIFREKIHKSDWPRLIACAVFGVALNQLLFFKGLSLTSPINAGLMMVTNPIFVLGLSVMFLGEVINLNRIIGILCGISGAVILIIYGNRFSSLQSDPFGDLCTLLNSLSYAMYFILVLPLMKKYHPITIMQIVFALGSLLVLPFGWEEFRSIEWSTFSTNTWWSVIFVVIGTTFFAYLLNTLALRELSAGVVSVYIYLQPLIAAAFAMLLGKDVPNMLHLLAALLIFVGVWLTTKSVVKKQTNIN